MDSAKTGIFKTSSGAKRDGICPGNQKTMAWSISIFKKGRERFINSEMRDI
jgi:hypothetical protein